MNKNYTERLAELEKEIAAIRLEMEVENSKVIYFKPGKRYKATFKGESIIYVAVMLDNNQYNFININTGNSFTSNVSKGNFNSKDFGPYARDYIFEKLS